MATKPRIGTIIRRARERQLMSQEELAARLHVSRSAVNSWERDRSYPRNRIGALEEVLGVHLGGEPATAELAPSDAWEESVLSDPDLPYEWKISLVRESRAARAEYVRLKRERRAGEARESADLSRRGRAAG